MRIDGVRRRGFERPLPSSHSIELSCPWDGSVGAKLPFIDAQGVLMGHGEHDWNHRVVGARIDDFYYDTSDVEE